MAWFKHKPTVNDQQQVDQTVAAMRETSTESTSGAFEMPVADVFTIKGRGTVLVGTIQKGSVAIGDTLFRGADTVVVGGLEAYRQVLQTASAGQEVGIVVREPLEFAAGDVLKKPSAV